MVGRLMRPGVASAILAGSPHGAFRGTRAAANQPGQSMSGV